MTFLKISEGVFVNTLNVLKFETTADSVVVHLVGDRTPIVLVSGDAASAAKWMEWLAPNTVNVVTEKKA